MHVTVPTTSLCPCSKELSDYGAHNQRSHFVIDAEIEGEMSVEEVIASAERNATCEVYSLLKRPDEKYVTEWAYVNPKFVEDLVRDVAVALNHERRVLNYTIEAENFESIHNHSAFARVVRRLPGTKLGYFGSARTMASPAKHSPHKPYEVVLKASRGRGEYDGRHAPTALPGSAMHIFTK